MAVTVEQVAKASLGSILVQGSEAPLNPDDYQAFIFALNNYMTSLDADGIALGYTVVSSLNDQVTIPIGALRGVIANMAIEVAPDYGATVTEALALRAKQGMDAMRKLGQSMGETRYPSTLPRGSGNYYEYSTNPFYPDRESEILAEATGSIALENGT
jgi:hypothetical protein